MAEYEDLTGADVQPEPEPAAETPAPQEAPQAPSDYNFNPDNYGVVFRSERVVPKDRAHLEELIQMGHSYSTNRDKFQGLEAENQRLTGQFQQYEALNNALKEHPELANKFETTYQEYMQGQQQAGQPAQVPPELDGRISYIEQKFADEALNREVADTISKHPDHEWNKDTGEGSLRQQLLNFMHKNSIPNPEHAYRAMMFEHATKQAQFTASKQTTQQIQKQHRAGVVAGGTATPPAPKPWNHKGKSYDDAEQSALQELGLNK